MDWFETHTKLLEVRKECEQNFPQTLKQDRYAPKDKNYQL